MMKKRTAALMGMATVAVTVMCLANVIVFDKETIPMAEPPKEAVMSVADSGKTSEATTSDSLTKTTTKVTTTTTSTTTALTEVSSGSKDDEELPDTVIPKDQTPVPQDQSAGAPNPVVTTVTMQQEYVPETVMTTAPEVPQEEVVTTVSTEMTTPTTTPTTTSTSTTTPTTTTRMEVQSELTTVQENWNPPDEEETTSSEKKFSIDAVERFVEKMSSVGYDITWDKSETMANGIVLFGGYPMAMTDSSYDLGDFVDTDYGVAIVVDNTANELTLVVADW
ncbi:MAG: hypothetical protein IJH39_06535 [Clostridia bacterium]|nr:hypothetical protein [Clostridia bacterium]